MNTSFLGMVNQTVQWNKCCIKWSINPIRKQKSMLHKILHKLINKHINMNTIGRNESKIGKKNNWTRIHVSTQIELDLCSFILWPFQSVAVSVCGHSGLWPFRFVAIPFCGYSGLWPFRFVAIPVCGHFLLWPFRFWPFWFVALMTRNHLTNGIWAHNLNLVKK